MVALLSSGHNEALVVRGVATEQIFQVIVALWSWRSPEDKKNTEANRKI